jgi:nickel transport protein
MRLGVALLLLAVAIPAFAHDLIIDAEVARPDVLLAASYGLGVPTAAADVAVYSPADSQTAAFTGQTDVDGRFSFAPSVEGEWRVVVDDGYGHREQRTVAVAWAAPTEPPNPQSSRWTRAGAGLVLIFGVTAFVAWGRRRGPAAP